MRKVICDRCGGECTSGHGSLCLGATHLTSEGEVASQETYSPLDLCLHCTEQARREFGFKVAHSYSGADMAGPGANIVQASAMSALPLDW